MAKLKVKKKAETTTDASPKSKKRSNAIVVYLPGAPRAVIRDFEDREHAFQKYRELCGIAATEHRPVFMPVNDQMVEDANGILIDEHGRPEFAKLGRRSIDEDVDTEDELEEVEE